VAGDICVVVGAGPSLGLAIAKRFAREGFRVALLSRRAGRLQEYVDEIRTEGGEVVGFHANPADFETMHRAFDQVRASLGDADVLIYNATIARPTQASELDVSSAIYDFTVNVAGALLSVQEVIPGMRRKGHGTIIFTGSHLALEPQPQYASLGMGKAALRNLARSLGDELDVEGVHVAMVTVAGRVQQGTRFDPDRVATCYWELYQQDPLDRQRELIYR
jgi:NAD(P)-dependent dehydrogenase (short-subunit alcohol dehydrogenase family)